MNVLIYCTHQAESSLELPRKTYVPQSRVAQDNLYKGQTLRGALSRRPTALPASIPALLSDWGDVLQKATCTELRWSVRR